MRKQISLLVLGFVAICNALDCTVSLPRLLIGNKYSNIESAETARILFDTKDDCSKVATLLPSANTPFKFTSQPPLPQYVDGTLSHNGQKEEKVIYKKYTMVFSIQADVLKSFNVGFQGNNADATTKFKMNYDFILPKLGNQNSAQKQEGIKFMFYGDQDLTEKGSQTLNYLLSHTKQNKFDTFIFLGDYAYEFYQNNGQKGDQFIEKFAPLSFSYPLVMTPGNHEDNLNFTLFNQKFLMPDFEELTNLNNYNSFNMGNVHFIHINLHFYSITKQHDQQKMLDWIKKDLGQVKRDITPWIIAVGHKLIYCYDPANNNTDCIGYAKQFNVISSILNSFGVDLFVVGHQHYNQVMAPIANFQIQDYSLNKTTNVIQKRQGFITIVQGNGGCYIPAAPAQSKRILEDFPNNLKDASLFLDEVNVGYGYIEVLNQTYLEYVSYDTANDKVLTKFGILSFHQNYDSFTSLLSFSFLCMAALFIAFS